MDLDILRKSVIDWIKFVDNEAVVVKMYQNSPAPSNAYYGLHIPIVKHIFDEYMLPETVNGTFSIVSSKEFTLELNYFGENALTKILNMESSLLRPSVQEVLKDRGLIYITNESTDNLTAVIDGNYEERAICRIYFRFTNEVVDDIGYFDKIEVGNNKFVESDGTEINSGKINIP